MANSDDRYEMLPLRELFKLSWVVMCRLMCHCVRHISLDNKYGRSVKAIHSSRSRWTACTELCAGTQEEPMARRARWGARIAKGAHGGVGSPP